MIDLTKTLDYIKHIPEKHISSDDMLCLWYRDNYDCLLVVEEWEFRIYSYEYWSEENIMENHEDEDWWENIWKYFGDDSAYLDLDTIEYLPIKFENMWNPIDMASELLVSCEIAIDELVYSLTDWGDDELIPSKKFIDFIKHWLDKIAEYKNWKVYLYYK